MNTAKFEYLLAIEKMGTITAAAEKCFVSASAVSQCLQKEEQEAGHRLFERKEGRMVPTRAGLIYLQTVKEMLEIHRETMDKLHVLDQGHGAVRLSVAPMLYEAVSQHILLKLNAKIPDRSFVMLRADSRTSTAYLLNDLADAAILASPPVNHALLAEEILGEDRLLLAVPKAYLRGKVQGEPRISDCSHIPFILLRRGAYTRSIENQILAANQISLDRIYEVDDRVMVKKFLEEGRGAAFLPHFMLPDEAEQHFFILSPEPPVKFNMILAYPAHRKKDKDIQRMERVVREAWKFLKIGLAVFGKV